ncbi:MAG: hypothetical protein ABIO39_13215, partial [Caulobacteraceae bacterium]
MNLEHDSAVRRFRLIPSCSSALGAALVSLALGAAALAADIPLRAAQWLAPGRDPVKALAFEPAECLLKPTTADAAYAVEVGRAAFRNPLLLGGQGARAGLSCENCHRGGRDNPDFFFPGLSDAAGTADVTSSVTSEHRGDGVFNPKPIPSLIRPVASRIVSRDPRKPDLRNFIHGLVTQEFDGPEPTPAVMTGLTAYVRALTPTACPAGAARPVTLAARMDDVRRAMEAAEDAVLRRDPGTTRAMLSAARSGLGLIAERYGDPELAR